MVMRVLVKEEKEKGVNNYFNQRAKDSGITL